jgi:hypothetical protein
MNKSIITADLLVGAMNKNGYKLILAKLLPNIIGIRTADPTPNVFNDFLVMLYQSDLPENPIIDNPANGWAFRVFDVTTDPGNFYLENPLNVEGTAILAPGQYPNSHAIGLHHGQYEALVQVAPVSVFRDRNKDDYLHFDPATLETGLFGINIHHASGDHRSVEVDKWSAGCTVFADPGQFSDFLRFCKAASETNGNKFTYTLITEKDLTL